MVIVDLLRYGRGNTDASMEFSADPATGALRDLNKAYTAFFAAAPVNDIFTEPRSSPVLTQDQVASDGSEGCNLLKAILQVLAASQAGRAVVYSVPNSHENAPQWRHTLANLSDALKGKTVGAVWSALLEFFDSPGSKPIAAAPRSMGCMGPASKGGGPAEEALLAFLLKAFPKSS